MQGCREDTQGRTITPALSAPPPYSRFASDPTRRFLWAVPTTPGTRSLTARAQGIPGPGAGRLSLAHPSWAVPAGCAPGPASELSHTDGPFCSSPEPHASDVLGGSEQLQSPAATRGRGCGCSVRELQPVTSRARRLPDVAAGGDLGRVGGTGPGLSWAVLAPDPGLPHPQAGSRLEPGLPGLWLSVPPLGLGLGVQRLNGCGGRRPMAWAWDPGHWAAGSKSPSEGAGRVRAQPVGPPPWSRCVRTLGMPWQERASLTHRPARGPQRALSSLQNPPGQTCTDQAEEGDLCRGDGSQEVMGAGVTGCMWLWGIGVIGAVSFWVQGLWGVAVSLWVQGL